MNQSNWGRIPLTSNWNRIDLELNSNWPRIYLELQRIDLELKRIYHEWGGVNLLAEYLRNKVLKELT